MQSQKQDAQRTLVQARTKADEYISDLEYQLKCTKNSLDEEQNNFASTREDLLKAIDDLQLQNSELRAELNKVHVINYFSYCFTIIFQLGFSVYKRPIVTDACYNNNNGDDSTLLLKRSDVLQVNFPLATRYLNWHAIEHHTRN